MDKQVMSCRLATVLLGSTCTPSTNKTFRTRTSIVDAATGSRFRCSRSGKKLIVNGSTGGASEAVTQGFRYTS